MKLDKSNLHVIYTIFVFVALASLDNAVIGLFPPLFSSIAKDLNVHISALGIISAANILVTAVSSIFWGYLADRGRRKRLIIIGTVIWSISVFLTAYSKDYIQLTIYQLFTGVGLGCIGSIGFSVLTDYIPKRYRGMLMSLWGLSQGFGGIAGSMMAALIAPYTNWREPFIIVAVLGLLFIFLYFFIKEPQKGGAEPELRAMAKEGVEYNYSIEFHHLHEIITKKSNKWLILQGLFMNITTGTLVWLPTLYISKIVLLGYSHATALVASGYLFALLQTGGLLSIYFGYLGDRLQRRTHKGRALLTAFFVFIAIPLYLGMFNAPMRNLSIPDNSNPIIILLSLIKELLLNPSMLLMFALAVGATAAQSANTPNWLALLTDVNLPEHRATTFSIANLVNGIGRAIGMALIGFVLKISSPYFEGPSNYIFTMSLFQIFFLPAAFCYIFVSKSSKRDMNYVRSVLRKRAKIL